MTPFDKALDAVERLKVFCPTGPGGGVDPTCGSGGGGGVSIREMISSQSRTAAVKSKIRDLEGGPVSYLLEKSPKEAYNEISSIRKIHQNGLSHLKKVSEGKIELEGNYVSFWRAAEARSGKVIPAAVWALTMGIPQEESYLRQLDISEKAIRFFQKRFDKKTRA